MKEKNKTKKVTALTLALVLLASCFTGGMLGKYITSGEGGSSARVAQWGVQIEAETGGFASEYTAPESEAITVKADEPVVAPGTSGALTDVSVTGKPEVAGTLEFSADVSLEGWDISYSRQIPVLPETTSSFFWQSWNIKEMKSITANGINIEKYPDWKGRLNDPTVSWTTVDTSDPVKNWAKLPGNNLDDRLFEFEGNWYFTIPAKKQGQDYVRIYKLRDKVLGGDDPIIWDEFKEATTEESYVPLIVTVGDTVINGSYYSDIAALEKAIGDAVAKYNVEFAPGDDLSEIEVPAITWEWPFSTSDENDVKDTALGNLETAPSIKIALTVTATQID